MTETRTPKDVVRRFLDHGWDRAAGRWDLDVIAECFDVDGYWSHTWRGNLVDTGRVQGAFFSARPSTSTGSSSGDDDSDGDGSDTTGAG